MTKRQGFSRTSPPRARFGEQTYGNDIAITVDGQETFKLMYEKIHEAKTCVYIANYDLDPALRFVRNSDRPSARAGHRHEAFPLQDLLVEKAKEGVEVRILVWEPRLVLRLLPGADERGIDGRADEVSVINEVAERRGISEKLKVRIDSTAPTLTSAHHEKIVIVDNQIGFCGGLDLSRGKWDTSSHTYDNPLRDTGSEPWHDVHLMVSGPVVWDLIYHFHQRWAFSESRSTRSARKVKIVSNYAVRGKRGSMQAIALRTWRELDRQGGIQAWYAEMFRRATKSIYIENQFPFQNSFATNLLQKRLNDEKDLKVIIVSPMEPNLPGLIGSMIAKMSVNDVNDNLAALRRAGGERVKTYSLVSQHAAIGNKRKQIYVHSKVMIVDDRWVTVGSANIDKNGFRDSSELNIGIESQKLARSLRIRLWREHLQDFTEDFCDFELGFERWKKTADDNGRRVSENRPITGHVYYYNFEEVGMLPPYPDAKGSTKFELL